MCSPLCQQGTLLHAAATCKHEKRTSCHPTTTSRGISSVTTCSNWNISSVTRTEEYAEQPQLLLHTAHKQLLRLLLVYFRHGRSRFRGGGTEELKVAHLDLWAGGAKSKQTGDEEKIKTEWS